MDQVQKDQIVQKIRETYNGPLYELAPDVDPEAKVFFKPADRIAYRTYLQDRDTDGKKYDANFGLAYVTVLYPDRAKLDEQFDRYPAFAANLAGEVLRASGLGGATAKKL